MIVQLDYINFILNSKQASATILLIRRRPISIAVVVYLASFDDTNDIIKA
jgi:hypothetical protein